MPVSILKITLNQLDETSWEIDVVDKSRRRQFFARYSEHSLNMVSINGSVIAVIKDRIDDVHHASRLVENWVQRQNPEHLFEYDSRWITYVGEIA